MTEPTIEYIPCPNAPTPFESSNNAHFVFGFYKVRFPDNFTVMLPHQGWVNTISATPLDLDDPEERSVILQQADLAYMDYQTSRDLDVLLVDPEIES